MQAQSRFAMSGGSSSSVPEDKHEAVVRELTRGHELTAQLRAEALHALRGQGQAEDTAAFILQEVSRAFTVCLSIMNSPARAAPPLPPPETPSAPGRQHRDENVPPRRVIVTEEPFSDGYMWRKYGQKRITNKRFPRCYFRCSYHRERGCPVTKQVQQHSAGDPPQYLVVYVNEHTCDTAVWEPKAAVSDAAANPVQQDELPAGLMARVQGGLLGERGVQEEHERQVLVSSLASVLGGQYSPACSSSGGAVFGQEEQQQQQGASASASVIDPSCGHHGQLPWLDDDVDAGLDLDVMDYEVTGSELHFAEPYGLNGGGLPF